MTTIKQLIQSNSLTGSYQQIADALNAKPLIDNPTPQGTVPAAEASALLALLPLNEAAAFLKKRDFQDWLADVLLLIDALEEGQPKATETAAVQGLVKILMDQGLLSSSFQQLVIQLQDNPTALGYLVVLLSRSALFSAETIGAIAAKLAETKPDPNYQAKIPGTSIAAAAGLPKVTAEQVQLALNS